MKHIHTYKNYNLNIKGYIPGLGCTDKNKGDWFRKSKEVLPSTQTEGLQLLIKCDTCDYIRQIDEEEFNREMLKLNN